MPARAHLRSRASAGGSARSSRPFPSATSPASPPLSFAAASSASSSTRFPLCCAARPPGLCALKRPATMANDRGFRPIGGRASTAAQSVSILARQRRRTRARRGHPGPPRRAHRPGDCRRRADPAAVLPRRCRAWDDLIRTILSDSSSQARRRRGGERHVEQAPRPAAFLVIASQCKEPRAPAICGSRGRHGKPGSRRRRSSGPASQEPAGDSAAPASWPP